MTTDITTDITFCISHLCPVGNSCRRYITETEEWRYVKEHEFTSFGEFEPEKGKDCSGYKHKAILTLNPLHTEVKP